MWSAASPSFLLDAGMAASIEYRALAFRKRYSPRTRHPCAARISSAMLVRDSRTSSAKGAFGRHEQHDGAGMRLVTAASYCRCGNSGGCAGDRPAKDELLRHVVGHYPRRLTPRRSRSASNGSFSPPSPTRVMAQPKSPLAWRIVDGSEDRGWPRPDCGSAASAYGASCCWKRRNSPQNGLVLGTS
jgi:hypothetical protein